MKTICVTWYVSKSERYRYLNEPFVIGCDTSDAVGNDDIGIVFLNPKNGEVIATGKYNEVNLTSFGNYMVHILKTYRKSVLIIERKSSGTAIIDHILQILYI